MGKGVPQLLTGGEEEGEEKEKEKEEENPGGTGSRKRMRGGVAPQLLTGVRRRKRRIMEEWGAGRERGETGGMGKRTRGGAAEGWRMGRARRSRGD
jgi:hypothetical protein